MVQWQTTRRGFLKTIGLGAAALGAGTKLSASEKKQRPNILFVFTDDQRWDTIRALGNPEIHTPNLDQLVVRGFHFNNAYCMGSMVGAVCLPSRVDPFGVSPGIPGRRRGRRGCRCCLY
jgi:hypothetical protein